MNLLPATTPNLGPSMELALEFVLASWWTKFFISEMVCWLDWMLFSRRLSRDSRDTISCREGCQ